MLGCFQWESFAVDSGMDFVQNLSLGLGLFVVAVDEKPELVVVAASYFGSSSCLGWR